MGQKVASTVRSRSIRAWKSSRAAARRGWDRRRELARSGYSHAVVLNHQHRDDFRKEETWEQEFQRDRTAEGPQRFFILLLLLLLCLGWLASALLP